MRRNNYLKSRVQAFLDNKQVIFLEEFMEEFRIANASEAIREVINQLEDSKKIVEQYKKMLEEKGIEIALLKKLLDKLTVEEEK